MSPLGWFVGWAALYVLGVGWWFLGWTDRADNGAFGPSPLHPLTDAQRAAAAQRGVTAARLALGAPFWPVLAPVVGVVVLVREVRRVAAHARHGSPR